MDATTERGSQDSLNPEGHPCPEDAFDQLLRLVASRSLRPARFSREDDGHQSMKENPIVEDIELRAYHLYLERGAEHGRDLDDWLEAEREVLEALKRNKSSLRLALAFGLFKHLR